MIEETMRNELKDVLDAGYTLHTGFLDTDKDHFCFYLYAYAPKDVSDHSKNIYGNMRRTSRMTEKEVAFAASYYLLGTLEGRGQLSMEKVTA